MKKQNGNEEFKLMESPSSSQRNEEPLVILKPKKIKHWLALLTVICVNLFFIFGVILPVIQSGDYSSVWPASDKRIIAKKILFYIAFVSVIIFPVWIPPFRKGISLFYKDRLEVEPFFGKAKMIFPYNEMVVIIYGNYRMVIYCCDTKRRRSLFQRLKSKYMKGIAFGLLPQGVENPEVIQKIINILKNNAAVFITKKLS